MGMVIVPVRYRFSQQFSFRAKDAYGWCTDYAPGDLALMGEKGRRKVTKITGDTYILKDTYYGKKPVTKTKLVRLDSERLAYTSTHIEGPVKYSQFLYQILPDGEGKSRLEFVGLLLCRSRKELSQAAIAQIARRERDADSRGWKKLAESMEEDLAGHKQRGS